MSRLARILAAVVLAGAALTGCSTSTVPMCDTDASCAALGGAPGYGVTEEEVAAYAQPVGPVLVAEATASPAEWSCLRELGYVGDPTDGVEALYAPASDVDECSAVAR